MEKAEEANEEDKAAKEAGKRDGSFKAKTCVGCMYYSSILKSQSRDPVCFGLSRIIQNVRGDILKAVPRDREQKMEAFKENSEGGFKYVCVGYSMKLDRENSSVGPQEKEVELPFCVGVERLSTKRTSTADSDSLHDCRAKDGSIVHPPQPNKPATAIGEDFLSRFERNATIVAGGVARNMLKVGSYVKANLEDILDPYRRPPK